MCCTQSPANAPPLRRAVCITSRSLTFLLLALAIGTASGATSSVDADALARAARSTRIADVDYFRQQCRDERTVEAWLTDLVGGTASRIVWRGGRCEIANDDKPTTSDSSWCGGATIEPKADPQHPAQIEIQFEAPIDGSPGKAFAFRAINHDVDGIDYKRDTHSFEVGYGMRFIEGYAESDDACH